MPYTQNILHLKFSYRFHELMSRAQCARLVVMWTYATEHSSDVSKKPHKNLRLPVCVFLSIFKVTALILKRFHRNLHSKTLRERARQSERESERESKREWERARERARERASKRARERENQRERATHTHTYTYTPPPCRTSIFRSPVSLQVPSSWSMARPQILAMELIDVPFAPIFLRAFGVGNSQGLPG